MPSLDALPTVYSKDHLNTTVSQVDDFQPVCINAQNCHPMQTRSKSKIVKKKVFSAKVDQASEIKEPQSFF